MSIFGHSVRLSFASVSVSPVSLRSVCVLCKRIVGLVGGRVFARPATMQPKKKKKSPEFGRHLVALAAARPTMCVFNCVCLEARGCVGALHRGTAPVLRNGGRWACVSGDWQVFCRCFGEFEKGKCGLRKESAVGTIKIAAITTPVACGAEGCVAG